MTTSPWCREKVLVYYYPTPPYVMTTRAQEDGPKEYKAQQKWQRETPQSVTYTPGLSTVFYLSCIVVKHPPSFLSCPRPPSHHPSSLTSVSLVPALHLLPPSTTFWSYCSDPLFPNTETISILSDSLYSLTPFLFLLSNAPLKKQT